MRTVCPHQPEAAFGKQHSNVYNHRHHSTGALRTAREASGQLSMHTAQSEDRQSGAFNFERARALLIVDAPYTLML